MLERDLDFIEREHNLDLHREERVDKDDDFYPQIDFAIRQEANSMAKQYEIFYSLETSIRSLIHETLSGKHGTSWWDVTNIVPEPIRLEVKNNMQRELDHAVAPRSANEIDYTTFGQLGDIVRHRWDDFEIFNSKKGFNRVMTNLNVLRGPIAHCCPLPKSEAVRLNSTVEDWFRLMS
tara:strand:- start:263 stop:796 length:534 start_codon:yes stop_codon:yes gene_type:complete